MACVKEGEAFLVMAAARVETARRAAGRRNRDMAGGRWKKINAGGFFSSFSLLVDGLYHKLAVFCCSLENQAENKGVERGRVGGLRSFRMVYFGVGISFSEGISSAGKKIPKLACQPIGAAKLFFFASGKLAASGPGPPYSAGSPSKQGHLLGL